MHVVITGASAGIGRALAKAFARGGHRLTLVARRRPLLDALAGALSTETFLVEQDLADSARAAEFLPEATAALGPVDVLVNNAGQQIVDAVERTDPDAAERMLALNLLTPLRLSRAVLPAMKARKSGTLVDVSSLAGLAPTPGMAYYNASKAGLAAFSESLRGELRKTGVHVVTVYPGPIRTALGAYGAGRYDNDSLGYKLQAWGEPDVLARQVVRAVDKRLPRVVYPKVYRGVRHLPDGLVRWALDRFTPALQGPDGADGADGG